MLLSSRSGKLILLLAIAACGRGTAVAAAPTDPGDKQLVVPSSISFRHDVIAALNVGGCNQGACHGTPAGKGGFRLSLRGYDPDADYVQLTRDALGRRTSAQHPDASLILLKALGQVSHEGGTRFGPHSVPAQVLRGWLRQGLPKDAADLPSVKRLEVVPGSRVLQSPERRQQLAVLAHFSDGRVRDVTPLTVFSCSDPNVAEANAGGLVEFRQAGEVAILCRYLETLQSVTLAYLEPRQGFAWSSPPENNYVDKHVFAKLKMLSIQPAELCSDTEFMRRAYLDLCAVLPAPEEITAFLADTNKDKRTKLIDTLLERPEYADFWTLKWMDVLRGSRRNLGLKGVEAYRGWMREHLAKNTRLDDVVRELLVAEGNTYAQGAANFYRVVKEPEELAETTAQLFFGIRIQCAKCHNHPFEIWTQDDYYSTAAFFARVGQKTESGKKPSANNKKEEAVVIYLEGKGDVKHLRTGLVVPPRFLGGKLPDLPADKDRREVFADWLTAADNPFFARSVVNRVWYHLFGRGIIDPVDDIRDSNPPANAALLDALTRDFVASKFDVKHLLRTIMNSRSYQLSALTSEFNRDDNKYFSHVMPKLLTAEQLLDAICSVTQVPENFPGMAKGTRAVNALDSSDVMHPFLRTFGRPPRESACECERESDANLAQALQLVNGATLHAKLTEKNNRIGKLLDRKLSDKEMLQELYLAALSRAPRQAEIQGVLQFVTQQTDRRKAWEDVLWALFNTKEFMYRH